MSEAGAPLTIRRAGVLLHPSSLPGSGKHGTLGKDARRFVSFLSECGFSLWQTLPLAPRDQWGSPYQPPSAHAGDTALIDLDALVEREWVSSALAQRARHEQDLAEVFEEARRNFEISAVADERTSYGRFAADQGFWLEDFALFSALGRELGAPWHEWPDPLRMRQPEVLEQARVRLSDRMEAVRFEQYLFFSQWLELKRYANARGVLLFGDVPIFVALDSADVWTHKQYFQVDERGRATCVAGVPPDYFSETGQRWGNPLYRWDALEQDGFSWWIGRLRVQLSLFDLLRIDHFRGLSACWEIPASADTARDGRWVQVPGAALLAKLRERFGSLPLAAEDLGYITPDVTKLRDDFGLPGMSVLQFAFDGSPDNPYLPHRQPENAVIYTGTHDNDTTKAWFDSLPPDVRRNVLHHLRATHEPMPWPMIHTALASTARIAVIPMQDLLALGSGHRMNVPGTKEGNWRWRFSWDQLTPQLTVRLAGMIEAYDRRAN